MSILGPTGISYLRIVVDRVKEQNLPLVLALLPMIESAYRADAISNRHAVGLWQFMPATAKDYGLQITAAGDGRLDVDASTQAALVYLGQLHKQFGNDWLLAIAAYNAGPGRVSQAIEANRRNQLPIDYWNLRLPAETQDYVPRLLALSRLVGMHDACQVKTPTATAAPLPSRRDGTLTRHTRA